MDSVLKKLFMKKIFLSLLLIIISLNSFSQGTQKMDSAQVKAANLFVFDLVNKTTIKDFQAWVYENLPARANDEFMKIYNTFIQQKYLESKGKK